MTCLHANGISDLPMGNGPGLQQLFATHVAQALKVVSTMRIFGDIERSTRAARAALRSGDKKQKNPPSPDSVEGKKKRSAVGKIGDDKEFSQLAFHLQLCFKFEMYKAPAQQRRIAGAQEELLSAAEHVSGEHEGGEAAPLTGRVRRASN